MTRIYCAPRWWHRRLHVLKFLPGGHALCQTCGRSYVQVGRSLIPADRQLAFFRRSR